MLQNYYNAQINQLESESKLQKKLIINIDQEKYHFVIYVGEGSAGGIGGKPDHKLTILLLYSIVCCCM